MLKSILNLFILFIVTTVYSYDPSAESIAPINEFNSSSDNVRHFTGNVSFSQPLITVKSCPNYQIVRQWNS